MIYTRDATADTIISLKDTLGSVSATASQANSLLLSYYYTQSFPLLKTGVLEICYDCFYCTD
jgi:hypothetical protein